MPPRPSGCGWGCPYPCAGPPPGAEGGAEGAEGAGAEGGAGTATTTTAGGASVTWDTSKPWYHWPFGPPHPKPPNVPQPSGAASDAVGEHSKWNNFSRVKD